LARAQRANGSNGTYYHALTDGGYSLGSHPISLGGVIRLKLRQFLL